MCLEECFKVDKSVSHVVLYDDDDTELDKIVIYPDKNGNITIPYNCNKRYLQFFYT